ncbi:MAG TPA: serine/threonine-protein kinase [Pyrinomonadaceae bacterium]|jgi:serine/threonine-protein kinase|nr:serine/threonine-protein kinase [Pyrinomonadaceae bacterium]
MRCPSCATDIEGGGADCPSCGAPLGAAEAQTRILSGPSKPSAAKSFNSRVSGIHSTDSLDRARFVAGEMIDGRYRIVGLLGRGGMGEVYRAEDLTLEQPVALKFLPETLSMDGAALARFHREVRVARQISHRNVCRVYDIGHHAGLHFLSMEYVRGEELSSVLKRFGRLPNDKAVEIARQMCAGLAAAHDAGVLHRDLKPANVMIDENGDVRITDFGLAGLAEEFRGGAALEGTPEYMSPEQLKGAELTPRSDIYSLGLVLYEVFTGKKAFSGNTLADVLRIRREVATPDSPSSIVRDLDPVVERVIDRCLSADPKERPATALQVAAALPGGDPLAAALAAGETPSPEMVRAAPKHGSLKPTAALAMLLGAFACLALALFLSGKVLLHRQVPLEKSAQGLRERAAEIVRGFGYETAVDDADGFNANGEYLSHIREHDRSPSRWQRLKTGRPIGMLFWYRQSPRYLVPLSRQEITTQDPPRLVSGMAGATLDMRGRLLYFYGVPPQAIEPGGAATPEDFDWSKLLAAAGLDPAALKPTEPRWLSPQPFDRQAAWEGVHPEQPGEPVRVEAAAFRGRPVYFQVINPWNKPMRQEEVQEEHGAKAVQALFITLFLVILLGAAWLARHNLRMGRGDRRGAFRLFAFFLLAGCLAPWLVSAHHVPTLTGEFVIFFENVAYSLLLSAMLWLAYIALEPLVRRRWPGMLIGWSRLLAGDYRDPLVGRDLLLGSLLGFAFAALYYVQYHVPPLLGLPPATPTPVPYNGLLGMRQVLYLFAEQVNGGLLSGMALLLLLLLLTLVLRRQWAAVGVLWLIIVLPSAAVEASVASVGYSALAATAVLFVLKRFGLLTLCFMQFFVNLFFIFPITIDLSAWYAGGPAFALAVAAALAAYGFYTSLAGQPLFRGSLVED